MAIYKFTKSIIENRPVEIYNNGQMRRDFTFITDIVDGIIKVADVTLKKKAVFSLSSEQSPQHRIFNIGHNKPVELRALIEILERALGKKAIKRYLPMQPGDLVETYADIDDMVSEFGFKPRVGIEEGIERFVAWFRDYHSQAQSLDTLRYAA